METDPSRAGAEQTQNAEAHEPESEQHHVHLLNAKNLCVLIAALMMITSILTTSLTDRAGRIIHSGAYFLGAAAYIAEIVLLTDFFREKPSLEHMFMPCIFGLLYIVVGVSGLVFTH